MRPILRMSISKGSAACETAPAWRRQFGLQLFKDQERLCVRTLFGSLTDPAFVSERHDAAAAALVGTVTYVWAGAVLHVRPLLIRMPPAAI